MIGDTLRQDAKELSEKRNRILETVDPYARRFIVFLTENRSEIKGFLPFLLPGENDYQVPFEEYDFEDWDNPEGLYFSYWETYVEDKPEWTDQEMNYSHLLNFTVPFDFLNDPEKWEVDFLARVRQEKKDAVEALRALGVDGEIIKVHANADEGYPDVITVELKSNVENEPELFTYEGHDFWNTSFNYYTVDGNVYLVWDGEFASFAGEAGNVRTEPFTGTLSNAEKELSTRIDTHIKGFYDDTREV